MVWWVPSIRQLRRRLRLPKHARRFHYALMGTAAAGAAILLLVPSHAGVYLFGLYSIPANSIIPVPHEPGLLYFAKYYEPHWMALAGAAGTAVAAFADYEVVERAFRHPKIRAAREAKAYRIAVRWLMRWPFVTCVVFAATPLPIYVVRVLAPSVGYPVWRYALALVIGRLPRFYAVAWVGHVVPIPTWILVVMFVVMIAAVVWAGHNSGEAEARSDAGELERDTEVPAPPEPREQD